MSKNARMHNTEKGLGIQNNKFVRTTSKFTARETSLYSKAHNKQTGGDIRQEDTPHVNEEYQEESGIYAKKLLVQEIDNDERCITVHCYHVVKSEGRGRQG